MADSTGRWVQVELTEENFDEVVRNSGRSKDDLLSKLDRSDEPPLIWVYERKTNAQTSR